MTTSSFGEPIRRREDQRLVTGQGSYTDDVGGDEILAAVSLMLMLALLWGAIYDALARMDLDPQAFTGLPVPESDATFFQDARSGELLYFSLVTLTTLGYGDILPVSVAAQMLVVLEVSIGYVMLGGFISILSNKLARRAD